MSSANAIVGVCVLSKRLIDIFSKGVVDIEYIAIANGSLRVIPSSDNISFPFTINKRAETR